MALSLLTTRGLVSFAGIGRPQGEHYQLTLGDLKAFAETVLSMPAAHAEHCGVPRNTATKVASGPKVNVQEAIEPSDVARIRGQLIDALSMLDVLASVERRTGALEAITRCSSTAANLLRADLDTGKPSFAQVMKSAVLLVTELPSPGQQERAHLHSEEPQIEAAQ